MVRTKARERLGCFTERKGGKGVRKRGKGRGEGKVGKRCRRRETLVEG